MIFEQIEKKLINRNKTIENLTKINLTVKQKSTSKFSFQQRAKTLFSNEVFVFNILLLLVFSPVITYLMLVYTKDNITLSFSLQNIENKISVEK
jgi:hypothetical protein